MNNNKYLFTCGDINGIGPEIVLKALNKICSKTFDKFYFICPQNVFFETSLSVRPIFSFEVSEKFIESDSQVVIVGKRKAAWNTGKPTKASGKIAFDAVKLSASLALEKKVDAIITAPISKTALKMAGINFPGHTEMYAAFCNEKNYAMMFLSQKMNASLVTIHTPLGQVSKLIKKQRVKSVIDVTMNALKEDLKKDHPKAAVLGLNPHAGEEGLIGNEEETVIKPLILSYEDEAVQGPFSPDAFFGSKAFQKFDVIIGMYHDQVLIPFKLLNFEAGVNFTAGLPIVRTSPDHGTAYDIAGKYKADESSIFEAYQYAKIIAENRKALVEA